MLIEKLKAFIAKKQEEPNKRKIENLIVFVIILIITIIVINVIWKDDKTSKNENQLIDDNKKLATETTSPNNIISEDTLVEKLEDILSHINGVGKVKVMVTYSQTSKTIPLYNQDSSEKNTEETDKQGGTRKIKETDTKTEVVYKEGNGEKIPITQSITSPTIEGAIITAQGAENATTKTNIIQAVEAVTGVATHKIQVFEMKEE